MDGNQAPPGQGYAGKQELEGSSAASPSAFPLLFPLTFLLFIFSLSFCWFIAPQPALGEQSSSGTDYLLEGIWYIALIMRTIFLKALQICLKSKYNEAMQHHLIAPIICQA